MRAYHFVNEQFGMDDLVKRRLKVATLNDLNDPFELFAVTLTDSAVRRAFRKMKGGAFAHPRFAMRSSRSKTAIRRPGSISRSSLTAAFERGYSRCCLQAHESKHPKRFSRACTYSFSVEARLAFSSFRIVRQRNERLWA
jgi:hypothetical protein